jgi:hypothetical protein
LKAAQHIAAEDQQMEVLLSVIHAAEDDMVNDNINSIQMDVIRDLEPLQQLVIEPHGRKLSVIVASANRVQADRQWEKLFPKLHRMLVDTGNAPRNIRGVHLNGQLTLLPPHTVTIIYGALFGYITATLGCAYITRHHLS